MKLIKVYDITGYKQVFEGRGRGWYVTLEEYNEKHPSLWTRIKQRVKGRMKW